jgi:CheY-like chemotaxis protein
LMVSFSLMALTREVAVAYFAAFSSKADVFSGTLRISLSQFETGSRNSSRHPKVATVHRRCQLMASGSPIRILIADDSPPIRRVIRRLLESRLDGAVVEEAENGREAIEKVVQHCPDVVVLDVAMPEVNGIIATERISAIAPEIVIVVHTMYATPQIEGEVKRRGAKAVISKDDPMALASVVQQMAGDHQVSDSNWL